MVFFFFLHLVHLDVNLQMAFEGLDILFFKSIFFSKVLLAGGTHDFRHFSGNELSEI